MCRYCGASRAIPGASECRSATAPKLRCCLGKPRPALTFSRVVSSVTVSGTAEGTTIEHGGLVQVSGGLTNGDTILGGEEMVQFGTAHVSSGGSTVGISGAGTAIGLTITSRGLAVLNSGGFAVNAAIVSSGALDVHAGAGAIDTIVGRGAVNIIGGVTSLTTVNARSRRSDRSSCPR